MAAANLKVPDHLYAVPSVLTGVPTLPGPTDESTTVLVDTLKDCYKRWHLFFNNKGFHNHATHHLFAIYAMGASGDLIQKAYETHVAYLIPSYESPEPITANNFSDHLGDERFYSAYLAYFSDYLASHSHAETLEHFVFSKEFNFASAVDGTGGDNKNSSLQMLNRLLAGLVHPMIHVGYGLEFGVSGQIAEGLSHMVIHKPDTTALIPPSFFNSPTSPITTDSTLSKLTSKFLTLSSPRSTDKKSSTNSMPLRPTFELWRRILDDDTLANIPAEVDFRQKHPYVIDNWGSRIHELVTDWYEGWMKDVANEAEIEVRLEAMVEEVQFAHTLCFGVAGWGGRGGEASEIINADFFLMHLVTSAIFLPAYVLPSHSSSLAPPLALSNRLLFIRTYTAVCASWYIARGRPSMPISDFYAATDSYLAAPLAKVPSPPDNNQPNQVNLPQTVISAGPNAWPRIINNVLVHPDEHMCKCQRALASFAAMYGRRKAGYYIGEGGSKGPDGADKLDGTLFVRVAGLVGDRLGWAYDGGELGTWDQCGFFRK